MIRLDTLYFDLVAASRLESMGGRFRKGNKSFDIGDLAVWAIVIAMIVLIIWLLSRYKEKQDGPDRTNSPRGLFLELCRAHKLKFTDRRLLRSVARWQRLGHPAKLFLEPERYEAANLSPRLRAKQPRLAALRDRLFAVEA